LKLWGEKIFHVKKAGRGPRGIYKKYEKRKTYWCETTKSQNRSDNGRKTQNHSISRRDEGMEKNWGRGRRTKVWNQKSRRR